MSIGLYGSGEKFLDEQQAGLHCVGGTCYREEDGTFYPCDFHRMEDEAEEALYYSSEEE